MLARMAKDVAYKTMMMPKYMASKAREMVKDRIEAQKNFTNRTSNKNYNRSAKYWAKNKD